MHKFIYRGCPPPPPPKKKSPLTLHPAPPPFWMPFEGKWHVYLNNYFTVDGMTNIYTITSKQKARKSKRDGIITQRERKSQRKYPISILGYGRGASYPSYFIFSVMWINIFIRDLLFGLNTRFRWMWLHILCIHSFHFPI